MDKYEIRWSESHDWHEKSLENSVIVRGDIGEPETLEFTNFKKLKTWAGY